MVSLELTLPLLLIASLAAVSVLAWLYRPLYALLLLVPNRVGQGEVHRLLTAGWIHSGVGHLAFNSLSLYLFADRVLAVLGAGRFLVLYVSAVVVAFLPTTLRHLRSQKYASLGASGAVAAVMFSGILLAPDQRLMLFFLPGLMVPGYVFALGYLAYSAVHSYSQSDNINHDAHFYGALYGAGLTYVLEPRLAQRGIDVILRSLG